MVHFDPKIMKKNLYDEIVLFFDSLNSDDYEDVSSKDRSKILSMVSKRITDIKFDLINNTGLCIECNAATKYKSNNVYLSQGGETWRKKFFQRWQRKRKISVKYKNNKWTINNVLFDTLECYLCDSCRAKIKAEYEKKKKTLKTELDKREKELSKKHADLKKWMVENIENTDPRIMLRSYLTMVDDRIESHDQELYETITINAKAKEDDYTCSKCGKKGNVLVLVEDQLEKYGFRSLPFHLHDHPDLMTCVCPECHKK